jgi:MYXO-CTERM domain-containing protein
MNTFRALLCLCVTFLWISPCFADQFQSDVYSSVSGGSNSGPPINMSHLVVSSTGDGALIDKEEYQAKGVSGESVPGVDLGGSAYTEMSLLAFATPGLLRLSCDGASIATSTNPDRYSADVASAALNLDSLQATFSDTLTIHVPHKAAGSVISVNTSLLMSDSMMSTVAGADQYPDAHSASSSFDLQLSGTGLDYLGEGYIAHDADSTTPGQKATVYPLNSFPATITAEVGAPFTITYTITLTGNAGAFVSGGAIDSMGTPVPPGNVTDFFGEDFSRTVRWGGISSIIDDTGQPITDWSVTSASGLDYSQPAPDDLPEPAMLGLVAMGLPLATRRRKKTDRD